MKNRIVYAFSILFAVYVVGPIIWIVLLVFRLTGKIRIVNPKNISKIRPGMIIAPNHPDLFDCMYEIFLVAGLFSPYFLFRPRKFKPCFTPDKTNFTDRWYWVWLRPVAIPVQRGQPNGGAREVKRMYEFLNGRGVVIHFFEGGRTCTGRNFRFSRRGKRIRKPSDSLGWLMLRTGVPVLPIWMENGQTPLQPGKPLFSFPKLNRGPVVVRVGEPIEFRREFANKSSRELTDLVVESLLQIADQE